MRCLQCISEWSRKTLVNMPTSTVRFWPKWRSFSSQLASQKNFQLCGYNIGDEIDVWSEIKLTEVSAAGAKFNYRLDYVLRRKGSNPSPTVIEVLTCSTSGGNRSAQTDMKSAFKNAALLAKGLNSGDAESPGVNLRQLWARMASQLIANIAIMVCS